MISLRLAVPAILLAAAVATCITYFATPVPPRHLEPDQRLPLPIVPNVTGRPDAGMSTNIQRSVADIDAFQRAAEAILKNAKASAREPSITGPIPLPRKRPIPRP
jgi:hypothetical protein